MHKPNVTLACVVHCKGKFLFVEELEHGKLTLNQPAGHLEADESLLEGQNASSLKKRVSTRICKV